MKIHEILLNEEVIYPHRFISDVGNLILDELKNTINSFTKSSQFNEQKFKYAWTYSLKITPEFLQQVAPDSLLIQRLVDPPFVKEIILDHANAPSPLLKSTVSDDFSMKVTKGIFNVQAKQIIISGYNAYVSKFNLKDKPANEKPEMFKLKTLKERNLKFLNNVFITQLNHELRHAYDNAIPSKKQRLTKDSSNKEYLNRLEEHLAFLQEWKSLIQKQQNTFNSFDEFKTFSWTLVNGTTLESKLQNIDASKVEQFLTQLFKEINTHQNT